MKIMQQCSIEITVTAACLSANAAHRNTIIDDTTFVLPFSFSFLPHAAVSIMHALAHTQIPLSAQLSSAQLSSGGCTHCTAVHNVQSSSIESLDLWWWWWWW